MIIYFFYDILLFLISPIVIGYYLFRSLKRGRPAALARRFGFLSAEDLAKIAGQDTIWVHAVSVGETIAVKSLLAAIKERFPQKKIVLSNVTETGRSIALKLPVVDLCIYFPFDYGFAVKKALAAVSPSLIVVVETEIWPNFLRYAKRRGIPVILANGRISDRSFERYKRLRWFFQPILSSFSALCMQTENDARRIAKMGAPPEIIHVTKNLKYDITVSRPAAEKVSELKERFHVSPAACVFTAGSTHQGEEEIVLEAYKKFFHEQKNILLILAPRHPERVLKVAELLRKEGIPYALRSKLDELTGLICSGEVLLVDTVGELMLFYTISDLVFVGGSFVPVGGHNVLEPASLYKPVIFGAYMQNFKEIASLILKYGGGVQVSNGAELTTTIRSLLDDDAKRVETGNNGAKLLEENSGATERHAEIIASFF